MSYWKAMLNREGPQNLGTVDWPNAKAGALEGQRFLITGILETVEREDIVSMIKESGGILMTVLSKKLTYLIVGRDSGPVKLAKASEMDIPQIDEGGFYKYYKDAIDNFEEPDIKPDIKVKNSLNRAKDSKSPIKSKSRKVTSKSPEPKTRKTKAKVKPESSESSDAEDSEESESPVKSKKKAAKQPPPKRRKIAIESSDSEDEEPVPKKAASKQAKGLLDRRDKLIS